MRFGVISAFFVWLLVGCASAATAPPETSLNRTLDAPPEAAVQAAEAIFASHNIPLGRVSVENRLLQSEEFTVEGEWEGVPLEDRFDCGEDMGTEKAMGARIELRMTVTAEQSERGTDLRLQYDARGVAPEVEAAAEGDPVLAGMAGGFTCHLEESFVSELLDEIRSEAVE